MQTVLKTASVSRSVWNETITTLLLLLAPIAPHVTEELWHRRGNETSIHLEPWPAADSEVATDDTVTMVIQVNGKVRDRLEVPAGIDAATAEAAALATERIQAWLKKGEVRRVIARPPKLVNIVIG